MSGIFLLRRLRSAYSASFWLSAAKPTHSGGLGSAATSARMSGLRTSSIGGGAVFLLDLVVGGGGRAVVGNGGDADEHICALRTNTFHDFCVHFERADDIDAGNAGRRGQGDRAADERDGGARSARSAGDGKAHAAAGQIGDAAHRVDGFERGTGRQQHMFASKMLGLEMYDDRFQDFRGFQHAPLAGFSARLFAGGGAENRHAVCAQCGDIALCGRFSPHFTVHRRGDEERAVACQRQGRQQIVGEAVSGFRQVIGRGGRDEQQVGFARKPDVRHTAVA